MNMTRQTIIATLLGLASIASGQAFAGACGGGGPGVFNVFSGGSIEINDADASSFKSPTACNVTFSGSSTLNVTSSKFYAGAGNCGVTPTGATLGELTLPTFPVNADPYYVRLWTGDTVIASPAGESTDSNYKYQEQTSGKWKNTSTGTSHESLLGRITFPTKQDRELIIEHNVHGTIKSSVGPVNKSSDTPVIRFRFDPTKSVSSPFVIDKIDITNQSKLVFDPGTYYIRTMDLGDKSTVEVSGNSGEVKLYILNTPASSTTGNNSCLNVPNCDVSASGINAKRLQMYIYNDDFNFGNVVKVAASIYVHNGDLILKANDRTAFIGEALAQNIVTGNSNVKFIYQDTGVFNQLYKEAIIPRTGEYSLAPPALPRQGATGDYAYIPYQTDTPSLGGHLKAFALQANGTTRSTAAWDADDEMTVAERQARLYSTASNGNLTLLNSLDDAAFAAGTSPTVAQIKAYTLNPNDSSGTYLAGRDPNGLIGRPHTTQPVILGGLALFHTDDGFLYAVDKTTGDLKWGYMPRPLVAELKNFSGFFKTHPMEGQIAVLPDSDGSTEGYVVGSARGGALHYALRVNSDGSLGSQVWLDERTGTNPHRPMVIKVDSTKYAIYVADGNKVIRRALATNPAEVVYDLSSSSTLDGATLTAAPIAVESYVLNKQDVREQNVKLFLGGSKGNAFVADLVSGGVVTNSLSLSKVGNIGTGTGTTVADPVLWLEHATKGGVNYLTLQSKTRLKAFKLPEANLSWRSGWTSYTGGSGYWDKTGTSYTAESTFTPKADHIQKLPDTGATITGKAEIAASVVFLPVQYETETACDAYLYLYRLDNGKFPSNALYFRQVLVDNLRIGTGAAYTPTVMMLNGRLVLEGHGEQNLAGSVGAAPLLGLDNPVEFVSPSAGGPSGWRELVNE